MANTDNLIAGGYKLSVEEQSAGGRASGEARRRKRDLKKAFDALLEKNFKDKNGMELSGAEVLALKQFEKALKGDCKAFEIVRDTSGQKPVEKIQVDEIDADTLEELENMVIDE